MKRFIFGIVRGLGVAGRATVALFGLGVIAAFAVNYTMTQGAGTTFASAVISLINYPQMIICDGVTGATSCGTVKPASTAAVATDLAIVVSENPTSALTIAAQSAIPAGTNAIGTVAIAPTAASGGWTHFSSPHDNANAPISTTVVAVKSSAVAKFGGYYISNTNATVACLQVFDVATAGGVTLGTTRPDMVFCVPATSGANLELGNGVAMTNGIQIAATTTASGSSALGAGLDVTIYFK